MRIADKNNNKRPVRYYPSQQYAYRGGAEPKKIYLGPLFVLILVFITIFSLVFLLFFRKTDANGSVDTLKDPKDVPVKRAGDRQEKWWNDQFGYNARIIVQNNNSGKPITANEVVETTFDHAKLVREGKSNKDGKDLKMIYLAKDNTLKEVDFEVLNAGNEKTKLRFALFDILNPKEENQYYYLYYGNTSVSNVFKLKDNQQTSANKDYQIILESETKYPLSIVVSRKWILKGGATLDQKYKTSEVKLLAEKGKNVTSATLKILDRNSRKLQETNMYKDTEGNFVQKINILNETVGEYQVFVTANVEGTQVNTPKQKIFISYPLYVNWSMDWEGEDVTDAWLKAIDKVATDYNVPITHYFNPRVFGIGASAERGKYLKDWVLNRKNTKGDEIQLHLHMWFDMVKAIGIEPKTTPTWDNGNKGHDVPTWAYTPEEFDKMVKWSIQQFKNNGLPVPQGYRAGGWQIKLDYLKVLKANGFKYDSSARDTEFFGTRKMQIPWNSIYVTTRPYKPSIYDMSKEDTSASKTENIGLWEFPNNGDNSSNYGQQASRLNSNFAMNYSGDPLKNKQVFCILSHAQYFSNDDPVLRRFFDEVKKHLAENDSGPVIYTTIENIMPEFEQGV